MTDMDMDMDKDEPLVCESCGDKTKYLVHVKSNHEYCQGDVCGGCFAYWVLKMDVE